MMYQATTKGFDISEKYERSQLPKTETGIGKVLA
jgi:hypothetical protein